MRGGLGEKRKIEERRRGKEQGEVRSGRVRRGMLKARKVKIEGRSSDGKRGRAEGRVRGGEG